MTRTAKLYGASLAVLASLGLTAAAHAQEVPARGGTRRAEATPKRADAEARLPRRRPVRRGITVTGSRVVRDGYNQPTPVTVAPTAELEKATPTNLADALNKLPQFANSSGPASNTQLQGNSGDHGNLLNLRGVGPLRALILLDGIRVPPTTFRGAVDVNTLPNLLVQRVDVVTGGASAAYGSDAVSGAINYVLDKKFQGVKGVAQRGVSTRGDLGNYKVGLAAGLGFADDSGHVLVSVERFDSEGITRNARIYGNDAYAAVGSVVGGGPAGRAANPFIFLPNLRLAANDFNNGVLTSTNTPSLNNTIFLPGGTVRPAVPWHADGNGRNVRGWRRPVPARQQHLDRAADQYGGLWPDLLRPDGRGHRARPGQRCAQRDELRHAGEGLDPGLHLLQRQRVPATVGPVAARAQRQLHLVPLHQRPRADPDPRGGQFLPGQRRARRGTSAAAGRSTPITRTATRSPSSGRPSSRSSAWLPRSTRCGDAQRTDRLPRGLDQPGALSRMHSDQRLRCGNARPRPISSMRWATRAIGRATRPTTGS